MPLILAPYTLGTQLPAAPTVISGGAFYYARRKRMLNFLVVFLVLVLC